MVQLRVAGRYAHALMEFAEGRRNVEEVAEDLTKLRTLMKESRDFAVFLRSPVIKREKKREVLKSLFEKKFHAATNEFLSLLAKKGREDALPEIIKEFFRLRDVGLGIVNVDVRSAVELSRQHSTQLEKTFEGYTKKKVRLLLTIDKQLKGGFVAKIGDTVFDGSVTRQLELLRQRFERGEGAN
jgi:F-type H+-transporting ATPase subunit delta